MSLRRRTPLRRSTPLRPRSPISRGRRPTSSAPPSSATELFKWTVCSEPCIGLKLPGHVCDGPLQGMHVVPKRILRRRGLAHLVWDPVNGVPGCYRLHRRHDAAVEKVPRRLLPAHCIDWAQINGLVDALDRHWPDEANTR